MYGIGDWWKTIVHHEGREEREERTRIRDDWVALSVNKDTREERAISELLLSADCTDEHTFRIRKLLIPLANAKTRI